MNLYKLSFRMVFLIHMYQIAHVPMYWEYKNCIQVGDFNFCHHHPTYSVSGYFIYIPDTNQIHMN